MPLLMQSSLPLDTASNIPASPFATAAHCSFLLGQIHQDSQVPFHRAASQTALHSWVMFSQIWYLTFVFAELFKVSSAHSSSLSRTFCRGALLSAGPLPHSIWYHQQNSWGCTSSLHADHLWQYWTVTQYQSLGTPLVTGSQSKKEHFPPCSGCCPSASSHTHTQIPCLEHNTPVSSGKGCGETAWKDLKLRKTMPTTSSIHTKQATLC